MYTSKRSPEPARGSKLPVKIGKNMTADEVPVSPKKHSDYDQFFFGVGKLRTSLCWYETCVPYT